MAALSKFNCLFFVQWSCICAARCVRTTVAFEVAVDLAAVATLVDLACFEKEVHRIVAACVVAEVTCLEADDVSLFVQVFSDQCSETMLTVLSIVSVSKACHFSVGASCIS